ncbi:MAG TPA: serine/threonine-protein kinase [Bacillota bacterium]|nr:serine/threonine-protein kinase [Bacillota bacterium]HOL08626.1 serine/threonine-protein kinase [Bacillota bacterium]HPO96672.1 serine/threonine-protein kinase [Bacillota bacterium]
MKYQIKEELSAISSLIELESEELVVLDKVEFVLQPKEKLRLDMQREIRQLVAAETDVTDAVLIKYQNFEKLGDKLYLVRAEKTVFGIEPFKSGSISESCHILLKLLKIMENYHRHRIVLGGVSEGLLVRNNGGTVLVQDPLVLNYLSRSLSDARYLIENVPEVIAGSKWDQKSDIFSWGVLAYRLLTNTDPFQAETKEERITRIVRMNIAEPKDVCPKISNELNRLILNALSKDPSNRPNSERLIAELTTLIENNCYEVSDAEAEVYQKTAVSNLKKQKFQENLWWWFKKYGIIVLIVLAVLITGYFLAFGAKGKPIITKQTKPLEVVRIYFDGVKAIDAPLLAEAAPNVKNSYEVLVSNIHVNNTVRRSVDFDKAALTLIDVEDLVIKPLEESPQLVRYQVDYRLKIIFTEKIEYTAKREELVLKPFRGIWRIAEIKPISENTWVEKRELEPEKQEEQQE